MFLNKLLSVARSPANVNQLSHLFQKCAISSTPAISTRFDLEKSTNLLRTSNDTSPIEKINEQLKTDNIGRMFAVVHLCGKQFKVTAGDIILVEGYWEPSNGDKLRLEKVLLAGSQDFTLIGRPMLQRGLVDVQATVIEKSLSHTRTHFKKKRRKQFMRINFQRAHTTMIRINSIELTNLVDKDYAPYDDRVVY